ncbi:MAG: dienelactone hydrolase family protein [Microbacteriaceae bacterium]|nr:dienelactone hydrolase family protein [Microbacteriaceae bacterium]
MAEVLLFHHAGGLTPGVHAFADRLRAAGHVVHTPDLYDGAMFDDVHAGVANGEAIGQEVLAARARAAAAGIAGPLVVAGMSLGCAMATGVLLERPDVVGALYLYGAVTPRWWDAEWPSGVPAQAHVAAHDEWREPEVEEEFAALGHAVFVYEDGGHLFLDVDRPDHSEESADEAWPRILAFLDGVDSAGGGPRPHG